MGIRLRMAYIGEIRHCHIGQEAFDKTFDKDAFAGDGMVVKKGKKTFHRFTL